MAIGELARQYIIGDLITIGCVSGQMSVSEFVRKVYPKVNQMPTTDHRFGMKTAIDDIHQHMDNNDDWEYEYLFFNYLDLLHTDEQDFKFFLEQYVHPSIRRFDWDDEDCKRLPFENKRCVEVINKYLSGEGYVLQPTDEIAGLPLYSVVTVTPGVKDSIKNIIFAAKFKPEIVFDDALNNDIRIMKNADQCLIYDRPIPANGVKWNKLVEWYAEKNRITENQEKCFLTRLCQSLDDSFKRKGAKSGPETWMLQAYYELKDEKGIDPPALIPQVYLYYDPQTLKQRGYKLFEHQKMDFLMVFSHRDRVVIEIDGKQHYAEGEKASPKLYADMVKAHREMSLYGYDVYRFGGYEFIGAAEDEARKREMLDNIKKFYIRLFRKYGIDVDS